MWEGYKNYDHYYTVNETEEFFNEVNVSQLSIVGNRTKYYNVPASFDIETSSMKFGDDKFAEMYIWQFGLNGSVIVGRTWFEFSVFIKTLTRKLRLDLNNRLIVYVHNLSYEFQFMRQRIPWVKQPDGQDVVFSLKPRKPIYALSKYGIEFRCSYIYSNYNLEYLGANLVTRYPVQKLSGDLDYSLIRHSATPLTDQEIGYCINDVRVVMSFIQEEIENNGNDISQLTLTNTGKVRKYCRGYCNGEGQSNQKKISFEYHAIMKQLKIRSSKEYWQLKQAFAGGFTHAGYLHARQLMQNVGSADLTSSYPAVMCYAYFPMSSSTFIGKVDDRKKFYNLLKNYCCLFDVRFYNIYSDFEYECYISESKCLRKEGVVINNGRVSSADCIQISCTEIDFDIISQVYYFEEFEIFNMRIYDKGYLPERFIKSILQLYKNKTALKGVEGKEVEYMVSKNMINSSFGMAVTDIVRDDAVYMDGNWQSLEGEAISQLSDYNQSFNRFLYYPWGVWVTAHARANLWKAIFEFGEDYVYADTDSIKGINFDKHKLFFMRFNAEVRLKLYSMCRYYKIPYADVEPLTKKGESKLLGVWDIEEPYTYFKTLGAKRYMYEHASGEFNITVAGVNKRAAVPYLLSRYCGFDYDLCKLAYTSDPRKKKEAKEALSQLITQHKEGKDYSGAFEAFDECLEIPPEHAGKLTHTYIDHPKSYIVTDYLGNKELCSEMSSTHLEPAGYYFSISQQYLDFLCGFIIHET